MQTKIQQMIDEESIVEFVTNEKKILYQYRSVRRLERPRISAIFSHDESQGTYECNDFLAKRTKKMREQSPPIVV